MLGFSELFSLAGLAILGKVLMIDLMLAGDNVVILASLAAQLPKEKRHQAIRLGIAVSLVFLIALSFVAVTLLKIVGVLFAGGVLLLWVAWKLFRELTHRDHAPDDINQEPAKPKTMSHMVWQVVVADLSMSLENVLAVAGAARGHPIIMFIGLGISVAVMGLAASLIAALIERHRWIAFIGLAMILWVACGMIIQGWGEIHQAVSLARS
jgi:YjbE family integral membrane protein